MKLKYSILAASLLGATAANAAVLVTWDAGTSTAVTGDSDIITTGSFVLGHNYGQDTAGHTGATQGVGGATVDVNGVTFTQTAIATDITPGGSQLGSTIYGGAGSADLNTLLDSNMWGGGTAVVISLGGLVDGQEYILQAFIGDHRDGARTPTAGGTNTITGGGGDMMSFIGTFTADASGEVNFTAQNTPNDSGISISGLQLRAVPEPSSAALLGLGGLALIMRRRK